jgi:hypothetical protein
MERDPGQRPERQLDHVVIELRGGEIEIMQPVNDQHRDQRTERPDQPPRQHPDQAERRHHRDLGHQIEGRVGSEQPIDPLDQPPGQGRQLVVAELPFAAVGQRLDQVERKVGVERGGKKRPQPRMHKTEERETLAGALLQPVEKRGDHRTGTAGPGVKPRPWGGEGRRSSLRRRRPSRHHRARSYACLASSRHEKL